MANSDDVLERADAVDLSCKQGWFVSKSDLFDLIAALADEVRELRRDRARLDWVLRGGPIDVSVDCGKDLAVVETRAEIDTVMDGGEV